MITSTTLTPLKPGDTALLHGHYWVMVVDHTPNTSGMTDTLVDCPTRNACGVSKPGRFWVASHELTKIPNATTAALRAFYCTRKDCYYHQPRGSWRDHAKTALDCCPNCGSEITKD